MVQSMHSQGYGKCRFENGGCTFFDPFGGCMMSRTVGCRSDWAPYQGPGRSTMEYALSSPTPKDVFDCHARSEDQWQGKQPRSLGSKGLRASLVPYQLRTKKPTRTSFRVGFRPETPAKRGFHTETSTQEGVLRGVWWVSGSMYAKLYLT